MHIAIDAHSVGTQLAGNETYAVNLIEALAEIDRVNQYTLYVTRQAALDRFTSRWAQLVGFCGPPVEDVTIEDDAAQRSTWRRC